MATSLTEIHQEILNLLQAYHQSFTRLDNYSINKENEIEALVEDKKNEITVFVGSKEGELENKKNEIINALEELKNNLENILIQVKDNSIVEIDTKKNESINEVNQTKVNAINELEQTKDSKIQEIETFTQTKIQEIDEVFENGVANEAINAQKLENKTLDEIKNEFRQETVDNALKLEGKKLLATMNDDGTFNDDGIFKIKEENGDKVIYGILDVNLRRSVNIKPSTFDILSDGSCVALYEFEGNANDTGGVYHGQETGTVTYVDGGYIGKAVTNGSSDSKIVVSNISINDFSHITYSFWVKVHKSSGWKNAFEQVTKCYFKNNTIQNGGGGNNNYIFFDDYPENQWIHITLTFDLVNGKVVSKSMNGTYFYLNENYPGTLNIDTDLYILNFSGGGYPLNGLIDNFRIFNRALTDDEVQYIYNVENQGA